MSKVSFCPKRNAMKIVFTIYYRIKAHGFQLKYHPKNYKITSLKLYKSSHIYLKKFFFTEFSKI